MDLAGRRLGLGSGSGWRSVGPRATISAMSSRVNSASDVLGARAGRPSAAGRRTRRPARRRRRRAASARPCTGRERGTRSRRSRRHASAPGPGLAAPGDRLLHEPGDVVVEEGERLLRPGGPSTRTTPRRPPPRRHDALDDEPVGRLDEQDLVHPALVDERADRPEDLLEVLARASLVDPHRASSVRRVRRRRPARLRSRSSGPAARDPSLAGRSPGRRRSRRV